jgi:hypothetical protein
MRQCNLKENRTGDSFMTKGSAIPALALLLGILTPFAVVAQDSAELLARMKAMEDRIKSLEGEVQTLKGDQAATQAALTAATPAVAQPGAPAVAQTATPVEAPVVSQTPISLGGAGGAASKVLNPDIAVIGDFLGAAGNGAHHGTSAPTSSSALASTASTWKKAS